MAKAAPKPAPSTLDRARQVVDRAVSKLEECVERVSSAIDGEDEYDTKLGSHLAYLAEHVTRALDGLRKLEAHDQKRAQAMNEIEEFELVLEYLGELDKARRATVRARLDELDGADQGVLS